MPDLSELERRSYSCGVPPGDDDWSPISLTAVQEMRVLRPVAELFESNDRVGLVTVEFHSPTGILDYTVEWRRRQLRAQDS